LAASCRSCYRRATYTLFQEEVCQLWEGCAHSRGPVWPGASKVSGEKGPSEEAYQEELGLTEEPATPTRILVMQCTA
jgi:hypothetical protein